MKTSKLIFIFLFFLSTGILNAQDSIRIYYSAENVIVTTELADKYFNYKKVIDTLYAGAEYDTASNLKSKGFYLRDGRNFYHTGKYVGYFDNKNKKSEGIYLRITSKRTSLKTGNWKYYYKDGKEMSDWIYKINSDSTSTEDILINFWDSTGVQKVTKGQGNYYYSNNEYTSDTAKIIWFSGKVFNGKFNGDWISHYTNGKTYAEENYAEGKLIKGKSYDFKGNVYFYDTLEVNPKYPGGDVELIRFLQQNVKYPKYERDNDIQGKVLVRFVVRYDGKVTDLKIVRGVSKGLDEESLRVIKLLPNFTPGFQRGQPVNVYFNLPVVFKLQ